MLKMKVPSRHIKSKTYRCFIKYRPGVNDLSGIEGHACECANGLPTIGCCSHAAAIIYFLSHARYLSRIVRPTDILATIFSTEDVQPLTNIDSDDND